MTKRIKRVGSAMVLCAIVGCGGDDEANIGSVRQAQLVCAEDEVLEGIDVSYYQGDIDWSAVAGDGVEFAISRVNHGGFFDPEFDTNWAESRNAGLLRGAYQYFDPGGDPVAQATTLIEALGSLEPGDLPPVIDVESTDGLSPTAISANVATWIDMVEGALGRKPVIYTGSYFWNDNVVSDAFADHPLWIAHYTTGCPNLPTVWPNWAFWQYTSSGSVAGIGGNVDRNLFNGSRLELEDLAANGYRAEVIAVDHPPVMVPGQVAEVRIELRNAGARAWGEQTRLGTTEPRDRDSAFFGPGWIEMNRVLAVDDVAPGESVELIFDIVAPAELGEHLEAFNLVEEGVAWFSDLVPGGGPPDDTIVLTIVVEEGEPGSPDPGDDPDDPGSDGPETYLPSADQDAREALGLRGRIQCAYDGRPSRDSSAPWWWLAASLLVVRRRRR
jgi:lysozyme